MPASHDYLRSQILRSAAEREASVHYFLGKAKVCNLDVAIFRNQEILWFQVSVGNLLTVQILQSQNYFSDVEESHIVGEESLLAQESEDLAALNVLKGHEEPVLILKTLQTIKVCQISKRNLE